MLHVQKAEKNFNTRPEVNIWPDFSAKGLSQEIQEKILYLLKKYCIIEKHLYAKVLHLFRKKIESSEIGSWLHFLEEKKCRNKACQNKAS